MNRADILKQLEQMMDGRIAESEAALSSMRESRDNDSKSTAGDKHEVGRAMAQTEMDNLKVQLDRHLTARKELEKVAIERSNEEVGFGSLVRTELGHYFIAIGLGVVEMGGEKLFAISPSSPIGQLMLGKKKGDEVVFNGRSMRISEIA